MQREVIDPYGATEVYSDGAANFEVRNGIFRCVFFSTQTISVHRPPEQIAVMRLAMPATAVPIAAKAACAAVMRHNVVTLFGGMPPIGC